MGSSACLSAAAILEVFTDEVALQNGRVTDSLAADRRVLARGVLPRVVDVHPGDGLQGGVALKSLEGCVWVRPFVFRQVCRNGAIVAHGLQAERRIDLETHEPKVREFLVREATAQCCAAEVFDELMIRIEYTTKVDGDFGLSTLPLLGRLPRRLAERLLREITDRFRATPDRTRFGLMNAITSLARDTHDAELRWDLEELGGSIPALVPPSPAPRPASACVFALRD